MTIKEIESRSGMTRANIRFYETEGLLVPVRLPNGYRDYSDEDLEVLKKIRLLRQLHTPLEEIRALQTGEQALADVLQRRIDELQSAQNDIRQASDLCRAMVRDGVTYQTLDPDHYLGGAHALPQKRLVSDETAFDVPRACPHPWRRWLARGLDFTLCGLLWTAVNTLVFRVNPALRSTAGMLFDSFAALLLTLLFEPLFLHFWGYTPGKFLFGLRITDHGRRLSYFDALCRTGSVLAAGQGLHIPVYSLVRNYKCYKKCKAGEVLPWEEDYEYELTDTAWWRIPAVAVFCAALVGATFCIVLAGDLPRNRGALTAADFAENFNDYARYLDSSCLYDLNADGAWSERASDGRLYVYGSDNYPVVTLSETNGVLTGVQLELTLENQPYITGATHRQFLLLAGLSFVCAQPDVGLFDNMPAQLARRLLDTEPLGNWCFELAGVELCCQVETRGYQPVIDPQSDLLIADEGQSGQYFHLIFTMNTIHSNF